MHRNSGNVDFFSPEEPIILPGHKIKIAKDQPPEKKWHDPRKASQIILQNAPIRISPAP